MMNTENTRPDDPVGASSAPDGLADFGRWPAAVLCTNASKVRQLLTQHGVPDALIDQLLAAAAQAAAAEGDADDGAD